MCNSVFDLKSVNALYKKILTTYFLSPHKNMLVSKSSHIEAFKYLRKYQLLFFNISLALYRLLFFIRKRTISYCHFGIFCYRCCSIHYFIFSCTPFYLYFAWRIRLIYLTKQLLMSNPDSLKLLSN